MTLQQAHKINRISDYLKELLKKQGDIITKSEINQYDNGFTILTIKTDSEKHSIWNCATWMICLGKEGGVRKAIKYYWVDTKEVNWTKVCSRI